MDLIDTKQVGNEVFESIDYDLVVVSSGFEERCTWLFSNYSIKAEAKYAISATRKHFEIFKSGNNKFFKEKGFSFIDLALDNNEDLLSFIRTYLTEKGQKELNILIDYSGMPKVWFLGLLNLFADIEGLNGSINVYFSYTPIHYQKSKKHKVIKVAESLSQNERCHHSEKPTVLIMGLGLESGKADYIKELISPDRTILMYADPAPKEYVELIFENNRNVIQDVDMRNMINYPLDDLDETLEIITNLILDLRLQSNIVLAPLGPKSFALVSMIINIHYPDVDIWRVSSNMLHTDGKQQAFLEPVILKLSFSCSEE